MRKRRWLALLAGLGCTGSLGALGLLQGWWRLNHPDRARFPIWGIDVSHHQGAVDWATVSRQPNLVFAYLKATEGGDWIDPRFRENWREARRAGLAVGAYHFFTFCRPALEQADHFLSVLPADDDALPPAVDVEFGGNCAARPEPAAFRRDLDAFTERVEAARGKKVVVYLTHDAHRTLLAAAPIPALWIRDVWSEPRALEWTFWQFANRERIPGIGTPVDLNAFRYPDRTRLAAH